MIRRASAAALLLVAFALRVHRLGDANVWWDEALAVWAVRKSFIGATLWTAADVHPPLFFWLQWPWLRLAGQTEFAPRLVPVGMGVLSVALAYALGRRLGGGRAGVLAAALVAASRFEVWWSMELRMYMLAGTAILLAAYAAVRWLGTAGRGRGLRSPPRRRWLIAYMFAASCALYTIYMAVVAVATLAVSVALLIVWEARAAPSTGPAQRAHARGNLFAWLAAQVAVVVAVLPWLWLALPRMQSWSSLRDAPASAAFVLRLWATLLTTGVSTAIESVHLWTTTFWACVLVVPLLLIALVRSRRPLPRTGSSYRLAWAVLGPFLVVPPLSVWAATQPRSLFYSPSVEARYLLPFAGPVYVLAAVVLGRAWGRSRSAGWVLAVGAAAALVVTLPDHYAPRRLRDEMQSMTLAIWSQSEPDDAVVLLSGNRYPMFLYYYDQPWDVSRARQPYAWSAGASGFVPPRWEERPPVVPFPNRSTDLVSASDWQEELAQIVATHDRVWLAEIESHLQDPDGEVETWLNDRLPRVLSEGYGPNVLHLYDAGGEHPRVTGVSSYWPWVRDVTDPAARWPWWPRWLGPPSTDGELNGYHRIVGAPSVVALPGDVPGYTLFETEAHAVSDDGPGMEPGGGSGGSGASGMESGSGSGGGSGMESGGGSDSSSTSGMESGSGSGSDVAPDAWPPAAIWVLPGRPIAGRWAPPWSQQSPQDAVSTTGAQRVLLQIPVSERFPAAEGRVQAHRTSGVLAPLTVRSAHPILTDVAGVAADFGKIQLTGVAVDTDLVHPGDSIVVDLYWSLGPSVGVGSEADGGGEYVSGQSVARGLVGNPAPTIFVHLVGPPSPETGDPVWAAHDGEPSSGPWHTQALAAVHDRHVLLVDPAAPPGDYELRTGLYDPLTSQRYEVSGELPVVDAAARHVFLATITVE